MWRVLTSARVRVTLRDLDTWSFLDLVHCNEVLDAIDEAESEAARRARLAAEGASKRRR